MSAPSKTGDEHLVVLVAVVEAAIAGDEGGNLLSVLDELYADALSDSRVGLLSLNSHLLKDNSLGHGGSVEGVGLQSGEGVGLAVLLISPFLLSSVGAELPSCVNSGCLSHFLIIYCSWG